MSWGALPCWVYAVQYEQCLAMQSCAFEQEWNSGTSKELPEHIVLMSKSTFASWGEGGWNYDYTKETNQ